MSEKIIVNSIICPSRRSSFSFFLLFFSFSQVCRLRFAADIEFRDLLVREWTSEFSRNVKRVPSGSYEIRHCLLFPSNLSFSLSSSYSSSLSLSNRFSRLELATAAFPFVFLSSFRFSCLSFPVPSRRPHSRRVATAPFSRG